MKPRFKFGLITGGIGLFITAIASTLFGICGPVITALAGGLAGYFTARGEKLPTQGDGAKAGAIAGAIAGCLTLVGQIIGGIAVLTIMPLIMKTSTPSISQFANQATYWISGLTTALCFGGMGIGLAVGTGAAIGAISTHPQQNSPSSPPSMNP